MADLSDRKKAMENQYFQNAEQSFRLISYRDRLFAKWVAGLMGNNDIASYADTITDTRLRGGGDAAVLSRVLSDLQAAGQDISEQVLSAKMQELLAEAAEDLKS